LSNPFDRVARWDDDAFVILMNNVTSAEAERICDRLRDRIGDHVISYRGDAAFVTVSIGIAPFGPLTDVQDILDRAELGQQKCSRYGGNRVAIG
ncbi:MAG: GGDEF domain-containing protein, partial [Pseudomonadota bacterium]